jgi:hypothetical protein
MIRTASTLAFALLVLPAVRSEAQAVAQNFEQLRFRVGPGDTVYVTGAGGQEREARVLAVSSSQLTISIDGTRHELAESDVRQIRQSLPDPLRNGAMLGAAIGIGSGTGLLAALGSECSAGCWAYGVGLYAGLGALVGTGIDALIKGRQTIYSVNSREPSVQVVVRPLLLSHGKGLNVSVQF